MICYKIKEGGNFCTPNHAKRWVQRVVLLNKLDVVEVGNKTRYAVNFRTKPVIGEFGSQVGGKAFEYTDVFTQILGTAEAVEERNYPQWRHNVQLALSGFNRLETYDEINRSEYFAALLDSNNHVWIFGFEYGLKPDPYFVQNTAIDTLTLRSRVLEDTPPLRYLGDTKDFWDNFTNVPELPIFGDFNDDFNNDFDNL